MTYIVDGNIYVFTFTNSWKVLSETVVRIENQYLHNYKRLSLKSVYDIHAICDFRLHERRVLYTTSIPFLYIHGNPHESDNMIKF
jgi:hypothetical protein